MNRALLLCGLAIWAAGTIALRFSGQHLLPQPNSKGIFILFAVSFPLMGWVVRRLCLRFRLPREERRFEPRMPRSQAEAVRERWNEAVRHVARDQEFGRS